MFFLTRKLLAFIVIMMLEGLDLKNLLGGVIILDDAMMSSILSSSARECVDLPYHPSSGFVIYVNYGARNRLVSQGVVL
jgi:hypothetical protein